MKKDFFFIILLNIIQIINSRFPSTVYSFGQNRNGELGDNTQIPKKNPTLSGGFGMIFVNFR
jgi:hypothetical protein